jgi:predicted nucleic acid-binding protein
MPIVIDTSAIIAVIVNEPERDTIIEITKGETLIGPGSIPWEIGNAFSAMFKQQRITLEQAGLGIQFFESIPLRYVQPDFVEALRLSKQENMSAYDAYFIVCALKYKAPLLTLDKTLKKIADNLKIDVMEV